MADAPDGGGPPLRSHVGPVDPRALKQSQFVAVSQIYVGLFRVFWAGERSRPQ